MSRANCCFLTCVQISQEAGQVVWYSLSEFSTVYCDPHGVGFGIVNKAKIDVFLELSCFFHDPLDVGNFSKTKQYYHQFNSVQSLSHVQLCDPMNCSTPSLPVHHQLPEFTQTHVHRVSYAIQPSHPLSSPSPPAPNPSHQSLFH